MATWVETQVPEQDRYQKVLETMRELARREPTMAMHVHIAVPSADTAIAALNGIRERLPIMLALSANSPFWQARDSGLASTRTSLFGAFPRTGLPPYFATYEDWAERVDFLVRSGAIPEPTFLWWDARLQPRFGTIEIRIADTQSRLEDVAALVALMQCLVKEAVEGEITAEARREAVAENRFIASRDGIDARLIDLHSESLVPLCGVGRRRDRESASRTRASSTARRSWHGSANSASRTAPFASARSSARRHRGRGALAGGRAQARSSSG